MKLCFVAELKYCSQYNEVPIPHFLVSAPEALTPSGCLHVTLPRILFTSRHLPVSIYYRTECMQMYPWWLSLREGVFSL